MVASNESKAALAKSDARTGSGRIDEALRGDTKMFHNINDN
jgi:hypothetical protein